METKPSLPLSAATSEFMRKALAGEEYETVNPRTGTRAGMLNAREVLDAIAEEAWRTGDPGLIFIDEINRHNPTPHLGAIEATNPCGEQPFLPYESCTLGSTNLSAMVSGGKVDWDRLGGTARLAVRFLDDVIDANHYPLPQIEQVSKGNRKIGLGIMGLAHMLARMGIPYDSEEAIETAGEVMRFISREALEASRQLARERGPFPNFDKSIYAERGEPPVRNATRTTVAPTGTISMIANTSSGIEPIIAVAYTRRALDQKFPVFDPLFREMAEDRGIDPAQIAERIAETGSVQNVKEVPDDLKALFRTAYEVPAEQHVRIQAAVQKFTDNAVSKTVNLPTNTTVEDVKRIFLLAHKLNCKGLTVFRKGSRPGALDVGERVRESVSMRERPKIAFGETEKFKTGCGSLYVHLNHGEEGLLLESFCNLGKGGGWTAQSEAMARLVSLCLRCGVDPKEVVRQLRAIRCPTACSARAAGKPVDALSCPDAIAQAIGRPICAKTDRMSTDETLEFCPVCGGPREPGRCGICLSCWKGGCQPA